MLWCKMADINILEQIAAEGWSEELAEQFERSFGSDIRRLIVLHIWKLGLVAFRFDPKRANSILDVHQLEVFESSLSDLWLALTGNVVNRYVEIIDRRREDLPFLQYLNAVIRNIVINNARRAGLIPRESERSILRAYCQASKAATRHQRMAQVKCRLQSMVEREILLSLPTQQFSDVYSAIRRVADYFFEQYLPSQCHRIRKLSARRVSRLLVMDFINSKLTEGLSYTGTVVPWDDALSNRISSAPGATQDDDEFLSMLCLQAEGSIC